jgi:hypothetical protein
LGLDARGRLFGPSIAESREAGNRSWENCKISTAAQIETQTKRAIRGILNGKSMEYRPSMRQGKAY